MDEDVALIAHRRSLADLPADVVKPVEDDVDVRGTVGAFASSWSIAPSSWTHAPLHFVAFFFLSTCGRPAAIQVGQSVNKCFLEPQCQQPA